MSNAVAELIRVVEFGERQFIPNQCPTCPHFKGKNTCSTHIEKVLGDEEIFDNIAFRYLDRDNPSKSKTPCELREEHSVVKLVDLRNQFKGGEKELGLAVVEYMNKIKRDKNTVIKLEDASVKKVIHMITLFKNGGVEALIKLYPWLLTNSRNNGYYSEPFEYFTGVYLFGFSGCIGNKKGEEAVFTYVRDLSKHRKVLDRMVKAYMKYSVKDHKPGLWVSNFRNFFLELLLGKEPYSYYLNGQVNRHYTISNSWGYYGNMRDALREATGFSDKQIPSVDYKDFNKKSDAQLKKERIAFDKLKENFANYAHTKLILEG